MKIGIMQGRLLPPIGEAIQRFPRDGWKKEFPLAAEAGLSSIEWIYEVYAEELNPISTDAGIEQIKEASESTGVAVESVCADYFMGRPFLRVTPAACEERMADLEWLIARCEKLGARRIILPFVDTAKIENEAEIAEVIAIVESVLPAAEDAEVELHLETSLPPKDFGSLLTQVRHPLVKANYDTGNSASLGYDPFDEFAAYGNRIGSVHIKDRIRDGGTVPLGQGATKFEEVFTLLRKVKYERGFILQTARDAVGSEVAWATDNRNLVEALWTKSA